MKLHSPEQVRDMFPEGRRPALKRLIAKAKEAGCCCKLGRGIGLTDEHVTTLIAYLSCSNSKSTPSVRRALSVQSVEPFPTRIVPLTNSMVYRAFLERMAPFRSGSVLVIIGPTLGQKEKVND